MAFCPPDSELRSLHAKLLLVESDGWLAALIGSSNATRAGLGLDRQRGHHELNLWIGCPATSRTAKHLRALARIGERIELGDERWEPVVDEDEPTVPSLPLGFVSSTLDAGTPRRVLLELDPDALPTVWRVTTPAGHVVLTAETWRTQRSPRSPAVLLANEPLPSFLLVVWDADGESYQATWTANVEDRSTLPPAAELAGLPVDLLIAALASTRPLPVALEHELRRREQVGKHDDRIDLDPLHRFDDSGLLLKRARHLSLALWRLQERLGRPATSLDALHWRLHGAFGPLAIVDGLISADREQQTLPGEAHFFLAELALTIAAVDWSKVAISVDKKTVRSLVAGALAEIGDRCKALPRAPDASLEDYVRDALKKAQRWTGV
jgi:hypothetical protein